MKREGLGFHREEFLWTPCSDLALDGDSTPIITRGEKYAYREMTVVYYALYTSHLMLASHHLGRFLHTCNSYPLSESPLISSVYAEKAATMTPSMIPMSAIVAIAVADQAPFLAVYMLTRVVTRPVVALRIPGLLCISTAIDKLRSH